MFLEVSTIPYSFHELLTDKYATVDSGLEHRPDKLVERKFGQSYSTELLCNAGSNVSPVSFISGVRYILPSRIFRKHFLRGL